MPQLSLKPVSDLLGESFFIPAYQRGYRWTKRQVTELLDDIWEFSAQKGRAPSSFYCLQPVVVKRRDESTDWELVDGQQRLTTILLILTFLDELMRELGQIQIKLTYETRKGSEAFLQHIDPSQAERNIDYFHICRAYEAIEKWFEDRHRSDRKQLLQALVNGNEAGRNVKVIWYELPVGQPAIPAFTRLNVGKIPLTSSELVRALFLRSGNFSVQSVSQEQLRIAQEWDAIEKTLQSNPFWYFMHSGNGVPQNRIEYIFDLRARQENWRTEAGDAYSTFHFFHHRLREEPQPADREWLQVKQLFMTIQEWFEDRTLYHLIGFLVHEGDDIQTLRQLAQGAAKSGFQAKLRKRIARKVGLAGDWTGPEAARQAVDSHLDKLEHGRDSHPIKAILLLFNIVTLLSNQQSNLRFPFDEFKKEAWDIEHVKAKASDRPGKPDLQRRWLNDVATYLDRHTEDQNFNDRIAAMLSEDVWNGANFDVLYDEILRRFEEAGEHEVDDGIGNLALLDAGTNRAFKNAIFPVKRSWILGLDEVGTFVPLCTRNVFLKCYSKNVANMLFWTEQDANDYRSAMKLALTKFFTAGGAE